MYWGNLLAATKVLVQDPPHCQSSQEIYSMRNTCKLCSYHLIWLLCALITLAYFL